jgi:hypothetical protein
VRVDQNTSTNTLVAAGRSVLDTFRVRGDGQVQVGNGSTNTPGIQILNNAGNAASGIRFGATLDTNLYRNGTNTLRTDSNLELNGSATQLLFRGAASTQQIGVINQPDNSNLFMYMQAAGDTNNRYQIRVNGRQDFGPGNAATDTNLYRSTANTLRTDNKLVIGTLGTADTATALCRNTAL